LPALLFLEVLKYAIIALAKDEQESRGCEAAREQKDDERKAASVAAPYTYRASIPIIEWLVSV